MVDSGVPVTPERGEAVSAPTRYRKTAAVEAMRWDGSRQSIDAICRWANDNRPADEDPWVTYVFTGADDVQEVLVATLEGDLSLQPGDYVLRGVQGEFWPCNGAIFEASYEAVTS